MPVKLYDMTPDANMVDACNRRVETRRKRQKVVPCAKCGCDIVKYHKRYELCKACQKIREREASAAKYERRKARMAALKALKNKVEAK